MIKVEIKKIISNAIGVSAEDFSVEVSTNKDFGDYSTNIAMVLKKNPEEIAKKINSDLFKKIEVKNGFINFFVSDKFFIDNLKNIDSNYGKGKKLRNKKIIVDYTDANLFKEFHIGHLMSNTVGESLSRIFEFQGAKIKRVCYQSDIGLNVAKAIWGILYLIKSRGLSFKSDAIKDWALGYGCGSQMYEDDGTEKKEILELNKNIYGRSNEDVNKLYEEGKKTSLRHFDNLYKKLGTEFDELIFESQVVNIGKKIVEGGFKKGVFEKGDRGAIIFNGEKFGLHTRVFINSEGLPTYEAKDLGLANFKYGKFKYDNSVIVTANEQNEYFKVMLCAMSKVNPKLAERTRHIGHGMLRLPEGKMSSRTGKVITAESLIEKVKELVKEKIKNRELSENEKQEIVETVAIGAIRYSILKQSIGSDITYDFNKSISFEGDSGPYLQYSYVRAKSILEKSKKEKIRPSFKTSPVEITQLEKSISRFPEVVLQAEEACDPHFLVLYLTELAGIFNGYYAKNKIVDNSDKYSSYRVALTEAFAVVMKNGLWMLGIKTLEKM